ncbi:MAG: S8 family serine peptidase [Opitutales bacterium]
MQQKYIVRALFLAALGVLFWGLTQMKEPGAPEAQPVALPRSSGLSGDGAAAGSAARAGSAFETDETLAYATAAQRAALTVPGEVLLRFASREAYNAFLAEARRQGLTILGEQPRLNTLRLLGDPDEFGPWYEPFQRDAEAFVNVPVLLPPFAEDTNLPEFGDGSGAGSFGTSALSAIGVPSDNAGWGAGVTVAVLDMLVGPHSALEGAQVTYLDPIPAGASPIDGGHGTAVASLVLGNGTLGINGVAPSATVLSLPVLDAEGNGDAFTLANAIVRAVDAGADIINMSLGSYADSPVILDAVRYAADRDVVLVAAAGNDGSGALLYPAAYDEVISVAAADVNEQAAFFSNFGVGLDVTAPGVGVIAGGTGDDATLFSGSSAGAPLVSGLAARILEVEPTASAEDVAELIVSFANDTGPPGVDIQSGGGFVNAQTIFERETPGIFDAAVADIYVDPVESTETVAALTFTVQNRGTEPLRDVELITVVDGLEVPFFFEELIPGQTDLRILELDRATLTDEDGARIEAVALPADRVDDRRSNNLRATQLRLIETAAE